MDKAHVMLRDDQREALKDIARRTGAKQSELIRQGVDLVIEAQESRLADRQVALLNVFGIWRDRGDLDGNLAEARRVAAARRPGDGRIPA